MKNRIAPFLLLSSVALCAISANHDYVRDAFGKADFLPHVYDDAQIVASYGTGTLSKDKDGVCTRTYSDKLKRWVSFSGACELSSSNRVIEEIVVGCIPTQMKSSPYKGNLTGIALLGVSLGDSKEKALKVAQKRYGKKITTENFHGNRVEQIFFFNSEEDTNLYYRFTISSGKVVALAIGVTE
jgi:hypothetical protein